MSETLIDAYASAWEPEDTRPACEWGAEHIKIPNSARSSAFSVIETPWLTDPINIIPDNRYKEVVALMPTGAGKTTMFDVSIPRAVKEDPGSILLTLQNDAEADGYWEERLMPIMQGVDRIDEMIRLLPRSKKKRGFISFPHLTLYCSSAKWKALQRKSVRWVFMDEVWMVEHGFIREARARTHDRWNQRVVLVSQGGDRFVQIDGEIVMSEFEEAWLWTDQRQYSMVCPECGHIQTWCNSDMLFENAETSTGAIDERAILESARYKCRGRCGTEFADKIDIRRSLSSSSVYVPSNDRPLPGHIGFHVHAAALYYVPWGQLCLEWKRANIAKRVGNLEPLKVYIQKRCAEFWEEQEHRFNGLNSDAPASDYVITEDHDRFPGLSEGFPWDDEEYRFMAADWQELDGHYFVTVAAAFSKSGSSRVIFAGRINSPEELRQKQINLGIRDSGVVVDSADDTATVNAFCSKYGWMELQGSDRSNWPHAQPKTKDVFYLPWSVPEQVGGIGPQAPFRMLWSNDYYHDLHARRLAHHGNRYGVPADIEDFAQYIDPATQKPTGFWPQMRATQKQAKTNREGKRVMKYVRIGKRPDHYKDARCMLLVRASFEAFRKGYGWQLGEEDFKIEA